jgi:DNA-binding beta-propeller fold protein YncE
MAHFEGRIVVNSRGRILAWCIPAAILVIVIFVSVRMWRIPQNVAYVTEEDGGISVVDLQTLKVVRRVHLANVAPRGLGITFDGKYIVTADKNTADLAIFSTPRLRLVRRIHVGDNAEFVKFDPSGEWVFASFEPGSEGKPSSARNESQEVNEPPAQIASFHLPDWSAGPVFTAGQETEGLEFSRDGQLLVVANEVQNTIGVYDVHTGSQLREIDLKPYGVRLRGVKASPKGTGCVVTMEASGTMALLDNDFNVIRSVPTAAKPYGVAFDREGHRVFVAAALAQKLQVFAADSLQLLGEVPVGKRCWHFPFTPDDSKILMACGRSNNIFVVDPNSYRPIRTIEGFNLPWGIVTYPRSYGSLGLP